MRTKWSGTVSQDAVLIKLRRRLKLILSSWPVHKKEKEGGYEMEGKRKERRKKKEAKMSLYTTQHYQEGETTQLLMRTRKRAKRSEHDLPLDFHALYLQESKLHSPPPPPKKKNSLNCLLYLLHWKLLILPPFLCSLYFSTGSVFPPAIPFSFSL